MPKPLDRRPALLVSAAILLAAAPALASPQDGVTGTTRGFVFQYFWYAMNYGADDCPNGLAISLEKEYVPKLYTAGRGKLEGKDALSFRGLKGTEERCRTPAAFEEPPLRTAQGKVAQGMDLDGTDSGGATANSCAHANFIGPAGETGIDNQLYRVLGCIAAYRPEQHFQSNTIRDFVNSARQDGQVSTVMELRGLDNDLNDDDVEVGLYSTRNPTLYDPERKGVPYESYQIDPNPRWQNIGRGKVVNGVLTTEPFDVRLDHYQGEGWKHRSEYQIKGARLRLQLHPDGSAEGMLAGYADVEAAYNTEFTQWGPVLEFGFGGSCPALYKALNDLADGYPDPATGRCTALSTAFRIDAVPAFLIHPKEQVAPTAEAQVAEQSAPPSGIGSWLRKLGW